MYVAIKYGQTTQTSPCGETVAIPFELEQGKIIVSYGVAMTGFMLDFVTDSAFWAEYVGQAQVSLVPNLIGNTVYVTANAYLTDFDQDGPRTQDDGETNPGCQAQFAVFVLIDDAGDISAQTSTLGNYYALKNGQAMPMPVGNNTQNYNFLSGFNVVVPIGNSGSPISELELSVKQSDDGQNNYSVTTSVATDSGSSLVGTADIFQMSVDIADNFKIVKCVFSVNKQADQDGLQGQLTATYSNATQATAFAPVLSAVNIVMLDDCSNLETKEIQEVGALLVGKATQTNLGGNQWQISWPYNLYLFNPDAAVDNYQDSSSTVTAYAFLQLS